MPPVRQRKELSAYGAGNGAFVVHPGDHFFLPLSNAFAVHVDRDETLVSRLEFVYL
jgi:hypothetical protein